MNTKINLAKFTAAFMAYNNSKASGNKEWEEKWKDIIYQMLHLLPHGSGIDAGVKFDWDKSKRNKFIFTFGVHHMDEHGGYDGWTEHKLIITPCFFNQFHITITGSKRNKIKEYLHEVFSEVFEVDHDYLRKEREMATMAA